MYYFASDMHLGSGTPEECRKREMQVVAWLDKVSADAKGIFLVGDVFDFWYEYKRVVPKGFTRLLGKLSELTDRGIDIYLIPG
ncbi:MAG: UDP-2,3-diacylglucosamine diphosphatase, partial [Rikenellaceae bacterium]|nr:UDP-2,3-diacylglucosamine diphosphatase [Rikenellaceae bacterium]